MVKDILRELKERKLQFLAILLITTLGVGFFIGIRVTGYDMRLTADTYMEDANVLDIEVMHSLGIDNEMIKEIDAIVDEKGYRLRAVDLYAESNGKDNKFDSVIKLYEHNQATKDDITILEGRLPVDANEAVIDSMLFEAHGIKLFDEITIKNNDIFEEAKLKVVGIGQSSLYMNKSRGNTSLGAGEVSGFVYAEGLEEKLDEVTQLRYRFDDDVDVSEKEGLLNSNSDEISENRFNRAVAPELKKLDKAEIELEEARVDGENKIAIQQQVINNSQVQLDQARTQLEAGMNELTFGFTVSTSGSLGERLSVLQQNFTAAKGLAESGIESLRITINEVDNDIAKEVLQEQLDTQLTEVASMTSQFTSGFAQLEVGVAQYEQGLRDLEAGQTELNAATDTLDAEIADNKKKIDKGRDKILTASVGELYVFDRGESIIGYQEFYDDSERIEAIGAVFPLIFFGVAILVTLSTVTRMIEESRNQIGVYKALGYTWLQASLKYVGFAALAWGIGTFFGLIIGFYVLPNIIYNTYRILYETPPLESRVVLKYLWAPVLISFLSSVGVAFYKSIRVSRERTAQLLRPAHPKSGQRILLERIKPIWNRLGFLWKVSFRNLFRNKTRFLMTVIGIGGCAGLLITGFGLDHSVNSMLDLQFKEIMNYDGIVVYEPDAEIDNNLFDDYTNVYSSNTTINDYDTTMYVAEDFMKFPEFFTFRDIKSKEDIKVNDDTVVLSIKLAEENDLEIGDDFKFKYDGDNYEVEVGGIVENYANHYLFMSEKKFEEVTLKNIDMNMRMFKKDDIPDGFSEKILEEDKILNVTLASGILGVFEEQMGNFDVIIYVVIIAAFLLELIVLSNLITMNISERKKELATLKVLGFYPMELAKYILRENITLTFIALGLGGVFGVFLHKFVIMTAELDMIMFNRTLNVGSVIISLVLTFVISVLINYIMSRRANDVDMSEALKTFDA